MNHYFDDDPVNYELLHNRAIAWLNTPYRHGGKARGLGVDCVNFVSQICYEIGVITEVVDKGYYPPTWYKTHENAIVEAIDDYMINHLNPTINYRVSTLLEISYRPGDLICLQINSPVINHVALKLGGNQIIHASTRAKKVVNESLEAYQKYLRQVYSFWRAE
jgi:cell wall-associated NlpC family hydrolase